MSPKTCFDLLILMTTENTKYYCLLTRLRPGYNKPALHTGASMVDQEQCYS